MRSRAALYAAENATRMALEAIQELGGVSYTYGGDPPGGSTMRRTLVLATLSFVLTGAPAAVAAEHGEGDACPMREISHLGELRPGLTLIDGSAKPVGMISSVETSADGKVGAVQYVDESGEAMDVHPGDVSYSGGDVAILQQPLVCGALQNANRFPVPLRAGVKLMDAHANTLGKISKVTAGPDGHPTEVEYVNESGETERVDAANLSYAGIIAIAVD